jgi:hypothetical protein
MQGNPIWQKRTLIRLGGDLLPFFEREKAVCTLGLLPLGAKHLGTRVFKLYLHFALPK